MVYVLCGLPFAGKTTRAKELLGTDGLLIERDRFLESINQEPETLARLRRDAQFITQPISRLGKTQEANAFNDALTEEYCRRVAQTINESSASPIVVDGTHLQPLSRAFIRQISVPATAVVMSTDVETCIARFEKTIRTGIRTTITPDMIHRMAELFEPPALIEGFKNII